MKGQGERAATMFPAISISLLIPCYSDKSTPLLRANF